VAATPTPPPAPITLARTVYSLPGDAVRNNGGFVGPFGGDRSTLIINASNGVTLGYLYFFSYSGDAFDVAGGGDTLYPNVQIRVNDAQSLAVSSVTFTPAEVRSGASATVSIGRLSFTVSVAGSTTQFAGSTYVIGSSVTGAVTVSLR
jgi:hypothetical protein